MSAAVDFDFFAIFCVRFLYDNNVMVSVVFATAPGAALFSAASRGVFMVLFYAVLQM